MIDPFLIGECLALMVADEKTLFVKCEPNPLDFTKPADAFLTVASKKASLKIPLKEQIDSFANLLALAVFTQERLVIAWDIKPVITYLKAQCKPESFQALHFDRVVDLKLCESYQGIDQKPPQDWGEAMLRCRKCTENHAAWRLHRKVHLPLATKVVPDIESWGLVNDWLKRTVYPSYTVEGQVHGRMSCHVVGDRFLNPHSLDEEQRSVLKPKPPHNNFVQFDYKGMEVAVLAWLTKDPLLGEIVSDHSKDVYREVFKIVTDSEECGENERDLAKSFFLPVFFGMQSHALSERLGVTQELAQQIIDLIGQKFPVAWGWVQERHDEAKATGRVTDHFGRVREVESPYLARHFCIAAPAALICMERLIALHKALPAEGKLVFSIHDGYLLSTHRANLQKVCKAAKEALEEESSLAEGLKIRTSCEVGKTLGKMLRAY
jgi:hypothetical protein